MVFVGVSDRGMWFAGKRAEFKDSAAPIRIADSSFARQAG